MTGMYQVHCKAPADADYLYAVPEIANFLSELFGRPIPPRKVYAWIETRRIPVGRFGGTIIASKQKLREHVERRAAGE
jgi:hypothetical protein